MALITTDAGIANDIQPYMVQAQAPKTLDENNTGLVTCRKQVQIFLSLPQMRRVPRGGEMNNLIAAVFAACLTAIIWLLSSSNARIIHNRNQCEDKGGIMVQTMAQNICIPRSLVIELDEKQ
jgi:hypothetical protein